MDRRVGLAGLITALVYLMSCGTVALANDCPRPGVDCDKTPGHDSGISVVGAIAAIGAGLLGKTLAGARGTPPPKP